MMHKVEAKFENNFKRTMTIRARAGWMETKIDEVYSELEFMVEDELLLWPTGRPVKRDQHYEQNVHRIRAALKEAVKNIEKENPCQVFMN